MSVDGITLGVEQALVDDMVVAGDVRIDGGVVAEIGLPTSPGAQGTAVPGFVDLQVNGFAGVDFLAATRPDYDQVAAALAATGVTAYLPTFVTVAPETYLRAFESLPAVDSPGSHSPASAPRVLGVHLEGPFISPHWVGAHDPAYTKAADLELTKRLLDAGPVRVMTLAPELPGALELIDLLVSHGVVVWCGHSDATAAIGRQAFDRGARAITHIYNAHRRWKPRDPGLAGAALTHPAVTVQAIVDDVHLAPETATATWRAAGRRFSLVTDAMAAAAAPPETTRLAGQTVYIRDGAARLKDETLAGSLLTMDRALANLIAKGATLAEAVHAASRAPALLIGRPDLGRIAVGQPADIVVLNRDLQVLRTMVGGRETFRRGRETPISAATVTTPPAAAV